jgi:hypothetical protein
MLISILSHQKFSSSFFDPDGDRERRGDFAQKLILISHKVIVGNPTTIMPFRK